MNNIVKSRSNVLIQLFGFNLVLFICLIFLLFGSKYIKSSILEYSNIKSDTFDGTSLPITFVPNWLKSKNTNKSISFDNDILSVDEFIELPKYDFSILLDSTGINKDSLLARYTYPVVYMGNYKLDHEEYSGSHPGVDIRAPIGTPVLSVANGVVVKIKNTETGDGKYVIIRHDNVKTINGTETIYSSYLHLNEIFAIEGEKISRGEVLGKVGMTGITTTPHLHFQIDRKIAPYNPYWPYTFKEASDVNLDFFSAVNAGLGKENAITYTINPMEFVQDNLKTDSIYNSAPIIDTALAQPEFNTVSSGIEDIDNSSNSSLTFTSSTGITETGVVSENINTNINSNQTNIDDIISNDINNESKENIINTENNDLIFLDIEKNSKLYEATKYLFENKITTGYEDKTFRPKNILSRKEALIFIFRMYSIKLDSNKLLPFSDIGDNDFIKPYLQKALDIGLISRNSEFRPDDTISRAEFIKMLVSASGKIIINTGNTGFSDIKSTDWYSPYIETFLTVYRVQDTDNKIFNPNEAFNRGQIANILYVFYKNK